MKVVMCITDQKTAPAVLSALKQKNYRVTELASEGGFMRRGNATYLIGVDNEKVSEVLDVVKEFQEKQNSPMSQALAIVLNAEAGAKYLQSSEQF